MSLKTITDIRLHIKAEMKYKKDWLLDDFNNCNQENFDYNYVKGYYRALADLLKDIGDE
jgi:hypothetical protein